MIDTSLRETSSLIGLPARRTGAEGGEEGGLEEDTKERVRGEGRGKVEKRQSRLRSAQMIQEVPVPACGV
jgi:hypothetical protein